MQEQPGSADEGIQATGRLDGRPVAVSDVNPDVVLGDCDPGDGRDTDLCLTARTIDGVTFNLVVENPGALAVGERVPVGRPDCDSPGCDDVTGSLVIDLRVEGATRPARHGSVAVRSAGPRFVATFDLRLPVGDRLVGAFDVAP